MNRLRKHKGLYVILLTATLSTAGSSTAQDNSQLNRRVQAQIWKIEKLKPSLDRFDAGDELANLTFNVPANTISNSTVLDLMSLLDNSDDTVRLFAAVALGNIQARVAIPKMLAMLPKADCIRGTVTSADSIRAALEKMKVWLPPRPSYIECHGQH